MNDTVHDPFHHLHDEAYADRFSRRRVGHGEMIAKGGRTTRPLTDGWTITPDLFDEGLRQRWFELDDTSPEHWITPRDWDGLGEPVAVPSCWNMLKPEWLYFEGAAWYANSFDHRPDALPEKRTFLRIGAANYEARIFLNGRFLASHRGGSTPFFIEVTDHLRAGPNRLLVHVDNRRRADRVPMHHFDWFNYGGIHREVSLVDVPRVFIRDCFVRLEWGDRGPVVRLSIQLSSAARGEAFLSIEGLAQDVAVPVSRGLGEVELHSEPELWSPARPRLYDVEVRFGGDIWRDRVGFRLFERSGTELLLNGEPVFLRGVCVHEDDEATGRATSEEDIRRRFRHVKELGANFVRLAHYPHHERVAEIADEVGVMLWAEIPVYWAIDFADPEIYADAENQLCELIGRDRNRASVTIWGVGNENADTNARLDFMSRLAAVAKQMDPSRLVAAACLINRAEFRIEDRLASHIDVIGLNEYFGWYEPGYEGLEKLIANSRPDRPVVVAEFGADALAGHHGGKRQLFTEECQAAILREQFARLLRAPFIRGTCPWLLYDFRSPRRQTRWQQGYNLKGLVARDKETKKLAFATVADIYAGISTNPA